MFGRANWSRSFLNESNPIRVSLCGGVVSHKVTPLVTLRPSVPEAVEHAALVTLFNAGLIPRICVSLHEKPGFPITAQGAISRLKVTFPGPNVTFSARSSRPGHILIYVSCSNEISAPLAA